MSCSLTQGFNVECSDAISGIKSVRIMEWRYLNDGTLTVVSGVVTVITPDDSKKFYKYELPNKNQDFFNDNIVKNNDNGTLHFEPQVQLTIRKLAVATRNEILLLAQARLAFIVENHDGSFWLLGSGNGMDMENSTAGTGAGREAFNGYVLTFNGQEEIPAISVPSNLIAAVTN